MGLVDYSDSDTSDIEVSPTSKSASTSTKQTFQKVVNGSGKIKVSLPQAASKDGIKSDEPPAKRPRIGGGGVSGFNSFLPAPKTTAHSTKATLGGGAGAKKGLGVGVNLKTGAAPGFSRESEPEMEYSEDTYEEEGEEIPTNGGSSLSLPPPKSVTNGQQKPTEEVKLIGKPLMFKPLSVSRKPAKKKKAVSRDAPAAPPVTPAKPETIEKPAPRPKVSLFSMSTEASTPVVPTSNGEYKPMLYEPAEERVDEDESSSLNPFYEDYTPNTSQIIPPAVPTPPVSQSLNDIAGDLNLSAAERRQLFGRQKGGHGIQSATKVINFNTDEEYLHNEELRAAGEQVTHNPVRSIAPGKHSLKQLVNAAQSQKEALEESFAKGRNNRAEASSRYGW
jgi:hypothetical protein